MADVRRDTPAVGTVVENRQILDMPLDGRNFLELTLLAPGAVPAAQGSAGSVRGDFSFSVNGGREDFNSFLLDGADNVDPKLNTAGVRPPVDAIQEFEVLTSTAEAAHGRQAASQISVVMKSGTNQLQGTAYTFIRNGALDATNYFAPKGEPDPEYQRDAVGILDRRSDRPRPDVLLCRLRGHASRRRHHAHQHRPDRCRAECDSCVADPPGRPRDCGAVSRARTVPTQVGNYVASPTQRDRTDHFDVRSDTAFGGAFDLMARYSFADRRLFEPFSGPGFSSLPGYGSDVARRGQNFVASATHIFSPNLLNETRIGFNRVSASVFPEEGSSVNRRRRPAGAVGKSARRGAQPHHRVGILAARPRVQQPAEQRDQHDSCRRHDDVDARQSPGQGRIRQPADSPGRVPRRAGARLAHLYRRVHRKSARRSAVGAADVHDAGARRQSAASANRVVRVVRAGQLSRPPERHALGGLAVRPDVAAGRRRRSRDAVRPADRSASPVGTGGLPRAGYDTDRNNWAPRIGAAWTVDEAATTVLRGAYGIHYNHSALAPSEGLYFSAPYFNFSAYFTSPPGLVTLSDPFPATSRSRRRIPRSAFSAICGRRFCTSSTSRCSASLERRAWRRWRTSDRAAAI